MVEPLAMARLPAVAGAVPRGVDLWCFFYEAPLRDPELRRRYRDMLTDEERARCDRFVFERDQIMSLATRALVRTALSHYAAVDPSAWRFESGSHGKPFVSRPAEPRLWFNLSNTRGLVVCAVSCEHEVLGVDAENVERGTDTLEIADRFFSPSEVAALRALAADRQHERFFAYWTLKESYIKARGLGLAIPLADFSFLLDDADIAIAFEPRLDDDATRWRFALLRASPRHLVAVGVACGAAPLGLRACRSVPLLSMEPLAP
jgi:4'-phosphopantetheinyl transferase